MDQNKDIIESRGLTFGQALQALEAGKRVAREGWNGNGMFLFLLPAGTVPKKVIHDPALRAVVENYCEGETFDAVASIRMKTADGKILTGWLASQSDMLAKDWVTLPALTFTITVAVGKAPAPGDWKTIVADFEARHKAGGKPESWQQAADYVRAQYGDGTALSAETPSPKDQAPKSEPTPPKAPRKVATKAAAPAEKPAEEPAAPAGEPAKDPEPATPTQPATPGDTEPPTASN